MCLHLRFSIDKRAQQVINAHLPSICYVSNNLFIVKTEVTASLISTVLCELLLTVGKFHISKDMLFPHRTTASNPLNQANWRVIFIHVMVLRLYLCLS